MSVRFGSQGNVRVHMCSGILTEGHYRQGTGTITITHLKHLEL